MNTYKVYTSTGTYTEADGPLVGDAAFDVQVIAQMDKDVGVVFESGEDFYIWRDERWWAVNFFGLIDFLVHSGLVLVGRRIDADRYAEIVDAALHDDDFPPKSAWKQNERRFNG